MQSIEKIIEVLLYRKKTKLAKLLVDSEYDLTESTTYGSQWNSYLATVNVYAPIKCYDELKNLSKSEKDEIIKAFHVPYPLKAEGIEINHIDFFVHPDKPILEIENQLLQQNEADTKFWIQDYFRIFISHSSKIKTDANLLSKEFNELAISGFVAHDDIEPTKEWQLVIEDALITCDAVVALLNEDFIKSHWANQEIGISYGLKKTIVPIRLGVDPFGFIGKYQGVQGNNKSIKDVASEIFQLLLKKKQTSEKLSKAIIYKFINSTSFIESRANVALLESVSYMDDGLLQDLLKSKEENNQIAKSYGVPERLASLINEWKKKIK